MGVTRNFNPTDRTKSSYGFLWGNEKKIMPADQWHYNLMQEAIPEPIVRGKRGIEVGSGCGYDTYLMAKSNPGVKIFSIDISDGIYKTRELTRGLTNVAVLQSSALEIPFKDRVFDFAYSFGVLHHTSDPQKGLREIARILKPGCPAFLYLYEDHGGSFFKNTAVKIIGKIRRLTIRIPHRILYAFCWIFSPLVFLLFTLPAKILKKFPAAEPIYARIPFNFGTGIFSLRGHLYDRFSVPIEVRYNREEVLGLFAACGFHRANVTRLKNIAGWVVWGYTKNA